MSRKLKILFKRRVLVVVIVFTVFAGAALVYTTIKSLMLDEEHLALIEHTKNINIEISQSRIFLDDYFIFNDTLKKAAVNKHFAEARAYIAVLDSFIEQKYKGLHEIGLRNTLAVVAGKMEQLEANVKLGFSENVKELDVVMLDNYHDFQIAYQELDKDIDDYILNESLNFKRGIFVLVFMFFCMLVLCIILIYRMINAYSMVEKRQALVALEVEYKERKRVAADLHDGLGSILSSIALFLKLVEKDCKDEVLDRNVQKLKELSTIALDNLEAAINNLNPTNLTRYGLVKSIQIICEKINETGQVNCKVVAPDNELKFEKNMEINLYRVCNEFINNSLKHSGASEILLDIRKERNSVFVRYSDNGKGFNVDLISTYDEEKMGLRNIVNRVESLGGKFEIRSEPGNGVDIVLQLII